ncbi:hypothetical protein RHSIM_Rhsim10G0212600 [Rhododendron simsii]|uniref:Uncharacterized protein n=1 Tax=Rhododendron simsii TaxID=118357 RepID=A0A834LCB3_RHOSS|nr:hypothetical protein RHSIM_Rhsim10G0212600 [Rhododendron simsii]
MANSSSRSNLALRKDDAILLGARHPKGTHLEDLKAMEGVKIELHLSRFRQSDLSDHDLHFCSKGVLIKPWSMSRMAKLKAKKESTDRDIASQRSRLEKKSIFDDPLLDIANGLLV